MKEQTIKEYKAEHKLKDPETAKRFGLKVRALGYHKVNKSMIFSEGETAGLVKEENIYRGD